MMWGVAILTMVVGSVVALTQTDVKRMLAYSSIAHAGFILTGVVAINRGGIWRSLFYLLAYGFITIGAFAVVTLVRDAGGEATHLSQWAGLARRSPLVAWTFTLFLAAFAGIPLTSGFTGKFAVFSAACRGGATPLVVVGVVASAVAAFFYVRVIVLMFFSEPARPTARPWRSQGPDDRGDRAGSRGHRAARRRAPPVLDLMVAAVLGSSRELADGAPARVTPCWRRSSAGRPGLVEQRLRDAVSQADALRTEPRATWSTPAASGCARC